MMKRIKSMTAIVLLTVSNVLGVIFGESWIIFISTYFHPLIAVMVLFGISLCVGIGIMLIYEYGGMSNNKWITKTRNNLICKATNKKNRRNQFISYGKFIGFIMITVTAGPYITYILFRMFIIERRSIVLMVYSCAIFSIVWVTIYSGLYQLIIAG